MRWADCFCESLNIDDTQDFSAREQFPAKGFTRDGYDCWVVNSLGCFSGSEMVEVEKRLGSLDLRSPVGCPDVDNVRAIGTASRRKEGIRTLRHALREKLGFGGAALIWKKILSLMLLSGVGDSFAPPFVVLGGGQSPFMLMFFWMVGAVAAWLSFMLISFTASLPYHIGISAMLIPLIYINY